MENNRKDKKFISKRIGRVMIAGTGSGCGKTTITCGLLKALLNKNLKVASFKCGPDYIDPMFHSRITGTKSRNLDMVLCGENTVKQLLSENSDGMDISVIEGVMGFYDGLSANSVSYSSNDISNKTDTPVILVINCKGTFLSAAAIVKGFLEFSPNNIQGVIFNGVNEGMYPVYKEIIEERNGIKVLGFMPNLPEAAIESRHLGLVTAEEIDTLKEKIDLLAENAEKYIDLEALMAIASSASPIEYENHSVEAVGYARVAVAMDKAFCFYYEDSLELLKKMGLELIPFSPMEDRQLPRDVDGIIIGGGYPELYGAALSGNEPMLESIRKALSQKIPVYAECGGFMYLGTKIEDWDMVGAIENKSVLTNRLQNFGYITLTAQQDNLFCEKGESINAHEFHYSKSDVDGEGFIATRISTGKQRSCIVAEDHLFTGYPHIHLWGNVKFAERFVQKCVAYRSSKESIL